MPTNNAKLRAALVVVGALVALAAAPSGAAANCHGGGVAPVQTDICTPTQKATLLADGMLIPPRSAPPRVKAVIEAANRIRTKPYLWGGGHARWWSSGYDCSGSVSYALHGGRFLGSPLPSGPLERWGAAGAGRWITVYANGGHAYAVIAGFRWDTAGDSFGSGPRWHAEMLSNRGFIARHPLGY